MRFSTSFPPPPDLTHHLSCSPPPFFLYPHIPLLLFAPSPCSLAFYTPLYFCASFSLFYSFPLLVLLLIFISNLSYLHPIPILSCNLPHFPSYPSYSHPLLVPSLFRFPLLLRSFLPSPFPFSRLSYLLPLTLSCPHTYPYPTQHPP